MVSLCVRCYTSFRKVVYTATPMFNLALNLGASGQAMRKRCGFSGCLVRLPARRQDGSAEGSAGKGDKRTALMVPLRTARRSFVR